MTSNHLRRVVLTLLCVSACSLSKSYGVTPNFTTLQPGQFQEIEQNLQINIVFVGYRTFGSVNRSVLLNNLPHTYRAIDRYPSFYRSSGDPKFAGNKFDFTYNIINSTQAFDDAYFNYLNSIAVQKPRTVYQDLYNQQQVRRLTVGQNYQISSVLAEKWFAENAETMLGVNTRQYTIFFVNWFGRSDFKFHVYAKPGLIDPDTGGGISGDSDFFQKIAQGGTAADDAQTPLGTLRRVWFYDLSAGPDYNTASWDITDPDIDGDGRQDYRIPPIWEYGNTGGYRRFNSFSVDHYLLARFVAINLLFTASPLYDVAISPPRLPTNIEFNLTLYEGNPARNGLSLFTPSL